MADRRRGVAGDDDRLDVALRERVERLRREGQDLVVGADAVRRAGVVAEVDRRFGRGAADDLAQDRQTAHPGVEDPDRTWIRHRRAQDRPAAAVDAAGVDELAGDAHDVLADRRVRVGQHERDALVVRLDDEHAVGHDAMLRDAAEGTFEIDRDRCRRASPPG